MRDSRCSDGHLIEISKKQSRLGSNSKAYLSGWPKVLLDNTNRRPVEVPSRYLTLNYDNVISILAQNSTDFDMKIISPSLNSSCAKIWPINRSEIALEIKKAVRSNLIQSLPQNCLKFPMVFHLRRYIFNCGQKGSNRHPHVANNTQVSII